jgi:hypothetical protein
MVENNDNKSDVHRMDVMINAVASKLATLTQNVVEVKAIIIALADINGMDVDTVDGAEGEEFVVYTGIAAAEVEKVWKT